jgi:hypothetical protein
VRIGIAQLRAVECAQRRISGLTPGDDRIRISPANRAGYPIASLFDIARCAVKLGNARASLRSNPRQAGYRGYPRGPIGDLAEFDSDTAGTPMA